jgi:hypothetical protein
MIRNLRSVCLLVVLTIAGCDPAYITRFDVHTIPNSTPREVRVLLEPIAKHYGFEPLTRAAAPGFHFMRPGDEHSHPGSTILSVMPSASPNTWRIELCEWFRVHQSPFGAEFQAAVISALEQGGYRVEVARGS